MSQAVMTQEDVLAKIYTDFARLASEVAIDRCRNRVLLNLVRDKLGVSDADLDELFRAELQEHLEGYIREITAPMLGDLEEPRLGELADAQAGCCGGHCG